MLAPLLALGQRSYEIYLTHMFAVLALFAVFSHFGKPLHWVPLLFIAAIAVAGIFGWLVAVGYAEPVNLWLRKRLQVDAQHVSGAEPLVD